MVSVKPETRFLARNRVSSFFIVWRVSSQWHPGETGATFGAATGAAALVAGLFVEFATTHFLLDTAVFDQFSKSTNRFLNGFSLAQTQLDHKHLQKSERKETPDSLRLPDASRGRFVKPAGERAARLFVQGG